VYQDIRPIRTGTLALAMTAALAGCAGGGRAERDDARGTSASPAGKGCAGTRPSAKPPFPGEDFNYGNRYLGVAMWRHGRLVATRGGGSWGQIRPDGSIWAKLGWWRAVPGRLAIQGQRLDAPAPPLRASVPAGYGSEGFQATGLIFPAAGCWRVVGSVAGHELAFVVRVVG
jgi:hypothetical protein